MSSLVEKSLAELEIDDGEGRVVRDHLCQEKVALQSQLADIKGQLATRLPKDKYAALMRSRAMVVRQLMEKEREISGMNASLKAIFTVKDFKKSQSAKSKLLSISDIRSPVSIRDEWHEFSFNEANTVSARRAAHKFSQQLRAFLKPHFESDDSIVI